jgi:AraC-like DNA-binding protein
MKNDDLGFELKTARERLEHYCRSTGVPARLFSRNGDLLCSFDASGCELEGDAAREICPVCAVLGQRAFEEEREAQLDASFQAERFGGFYIRLCPHSLLIWAAPIISDGIMRAAFVGGPVMIIETDEIIEELASSGGMDEDGRSALKETLDSACRVSPRRATSLGEILSDIASVIVQPSILREKRELEERRSRISESIHDLKSGADRQKAPSYPIEKERELLGAISRGDKAEAQRLLNEILGYIFFSTGSNLRAVKARVLELVVLLSRAALEGGADIERIFGLNYEYLEEIARMRSIDDLALWLAGIMVRFTELVLPLEGVKHADAMQKAIKYVNAHYAEQITLEDVARVAKLSPTYFSKLFSEEMGCRFTVYLNKLRVERAKFLLSDTEAPLVDIALRVGFEDQSYFTKVFRKIAGLSPGKYRESGARRTQRK